MSKELMRKSSKSTIAIPAHAKEIETNSHFIERAINSCVLGVFNIPTIAIAQGAEGWQGVEGIMMQTICVSISLITAFTIPQFFGTEPEVKSLRQDIKSHFAKIPGLHFLVNETFTASKGGENLIIEMKHGKSTVYNITQPNPKDLWDKMYESETGQSVSKDFSLFKVS